MCITRTTRRAQLTGAPRDSARSRHTAPAPLLYLLHPSRFSESTGCLWLAKAYLPTPEGISTWVGPTALSGKPPLDSVQTQKCQESEISTSSRWQLNAPSTLARVDGKLPRVPQTKASQVGGKPGCRRSTTPYVCWKHTEQNDHGMGGGTSPEESTGPAQPTFSRGDRPPCVPSSLPSSTLCLKFKSHGVLMNPAASDPSTPAGRLH